MIGAVRYAIRQLAATPGFTIIAVLIAAIGIGASTAMFSTVHAVVLKPLSLPEADRLVVVYETNLERDVPFFSVSVPNYVDFKARATSFASMAAESWRAMNLTGSGEPRLIQVRTVTANFLATLGVRMGQGRDFAAEDDRPNGPKVAVISGGFWRRHFGGRPDVIGQTLQLDGAAYAVIGVTAEGLPLPGDIEIAVPMQADVAKYIPYGASNRQAYKLIPPDIAARLPSSPEHRAQGFLMNGKWWADNRTKVSERWSQWLLQKG